MIIHKEYAIRRFCQAPLEHKFSRYLLEKILAEPDLLARLVFVTARDFFPNTMLVAEKGAHKRGFELELGTVKSEKVTLENGRLLREKRKDREVWIVDPLEAWKILEDFSGILHVQFVFAEKVPDWYEEVAVPSEAVCSETLRPGFAAFVREQIDLVLWAILLKEEIDQALQQRDEALFYKTVKLYKQACRSCFWKLS
ncbi:MAG TPA: IDEAL domain-containing protein [Firmicutes bacterium]|nr:IDEAL domain-containing protein [Bacillota bacterium]